MKKLVTLASVGVFLLSLQGLTLAQEKAPMPAPATPPAATTPMAPPAETQAAPQQEGRRFGLTRVAGKGILGRERRGEVERLVRRNERRLLRCVASS